MLNCMLYVSNNVHKVINIEVEALLCLNLGLLVFYSNDLASWFIINHTETSIAVLDYKKYIQYFFLCFCEYFSLLILHCRLKKKLSTFQNCSIKEAGMIVPSFLNRKEKVKQVLKRKNITSNIPGCDIIIVLLFIFFWLCWHNCALTVMAKEFCEWKRSEVIKGKREKNEQQ